MPGEEFLETEDNYRNEGDKLAEENNMSSLEAFNSIVAISTSHEESYTDEDYNGDLVYESWQEYDGTIAEQCPYMTKIIRQDLLNYQKLKKRISEMVKYFKKEIDTGKDVFGDEVKGANMLATMNCYNQFIVLDAICKEIHDEKKS